MGLVERLEKRAKELDPRGRSGYCDDFYSMQIADDRELFEQAAAALRGGVPLLRTVPEANYDQLRRNGFITWQK